MELKDYLLIILKYMWLLILGGIVGLALGAVVAYYLNFFPVFAATSTVMVGGDLAAAEENRSYSSLDDEFLQTYADLATRDPTMIAVINELGLQMTADDLADKVTSEVVEDTKLIEITARDENPKMAAIIADSVAQQLVSMPSLRVRNFVVLVEEAQVPNFIDLLGIAIVLTSGILGMLFVGGVVFLIEFLRDPVYSAMELTQRTNLPVLATIRRASRRRLTRRHLPAWHSGNEAVWWPMIQACHRYFDDLKASSDCHSKQLRILVTTPTNGQEKAIAAANLAVTWAKAGKKVILMDTDLVSPVLDKWFQLSQQPGLADLLTEPSKNSQTQKVLQPANIPGLTILSAGTHRKSSNGLLSPYSLGQVVENLEADADVIILNGAPLLTTSEGPMIAAHAHGVILVLRTGETKMAAVNDARDVLALTQSNLWGTILM